jgi:spore germination cell wall hydrolase CwlJ-like protein
LQIGTQASAEWRVLISAALIGSGVGLALGAAYMAGGMARAATDHSRAARIAQAAEGGFSETMLQREAAGMNPGALRVARQHDPFTTAGAPERDRQAAILAASLERRQAAAPTPAMVRASFGGAYQRPVDPQHLAGPLDRSRELDCLTQAVYFEARGETSRGQAAVAQVVMNRVKHPAFPKTVCGVVFQGAASHGCQFSFVCDGSMRHGHEGDAWTRARKVAARALAGVAAADIGSATHFHTTGVAPAWGPRMLRVAQVGLHVFYRFSPRSLAPAIAPEAPPRAVFASLPTPGAPIDIRLASALVEKASDAPAQPAPDAKPAAAKPAEAKAPEATTASLTKTSEAAPKPAKAPDITAS